jgi:general secretion pathway protein I
MLSIKKLNAFGLLEAIVALVLVSMVGLALFTWINSNLSILYRLQETQQRHEAARNAMIFMENINPMQEPNGEHDLGYYRFVWRSKVLVEPINSASGLRGVGLYIIGLYEMQVDIYLEQQLITQISLQQVGYEQVRQPAWLEF